MAPAETSQPWAWHISSGAPSKSPSGTAAGCTLHRTGLPVPGRAALCPLPAFLWGQASWDISGQAGLWGGLHCRGKCSAEHLPSALTQRPEVAALGFFRSFLLLPYCPTLCGFAQVAVTILSFPPWASPARTGLCPVPPRKDTSCRSKPWSGMQAGPQQRCFLSAIVCPSQRQADLSPPRRREKLVPGTLAQVPVCHLPQLAAGDTHTSPLPHP